MEVSTACALYREMLKALSEDGKKEFFRMSGLSLKNEVKKVKVKRIAKPIITEAESDEFVLLHLFKHHDKKTRINK